MHDPLMKQGTLQNTFKAAGANGMLTANLREVGIPDNREPEVSYLMKDIRSIHSIYDMLAASDDVLIVPSGTRVNPGILISLGLDTVNDEGYPSREVEKAGYTIRNRFSYQPGAVREPFKRFDRSVKSIEKTDLRKEWEASCASIDFQLTRLRW